MTYDMTSRTSRQGLHLKFPAEGNFSNEDVGNLGTVIHETTRILAKVIQQNIYVIMI